jgi:membrane fusion protein (multidrug efflux system)
MRKILKLTFDAAGSSLRGKPGQVVTRHSSLLLALALAFGLAGCGPSTGAQGEEQAAKPEEAVAEVTVTKVARESISLTLQISGTIAAVPNRDAKVSAQVPGRIAELLANEGDVVEEGHVLARIESEPQRDQERQAQAALEQAKATLENAQLNQQRNETLFQRGIASRKELEDARTQVTVGEAALRQANAALQLARLQVQRTEIHSPLAGVVVKRFLSAGEQVDGTPAQPICEVADLAQVELFASVPGTYLASIHVGQTLPLVSDTFPGRQFQGKVVAISPVVDPATNVGVVRIRFDNPSRALLLGMFLTSRVPLVTHPRALVVPIQALYRNEENAPQVYRVKGEEAEAVAVEPGIETKDKVELLSGVQEGDTVILAGGYGLPEKTKIKIKQ